MGRVTVAQVEAALKTKAGNVAAVARELGVTRKTIYNKINASATLQDVLIDTREELVDMAESALRREVLKGNITAIIFTLKTQGKDRGYVERVQQEVSGKDGEPLTITLTSDLMAQAQQAAQQHARGLVGDDSDD